jgi:hypothetical protein
MPNHDNMTNRKKIAHLAEERTMKGALIVAKGRHRDCAEAGVIGLGMRHKAYINSGQLSRRRGREKDCTGRGESQQQLRDNLGVI